MFSNISQSFKGAINKLRFSDDEKALKKALDFLKKTLLKGDVHFKVVKELITNIEKDVKSGLIGRDLFLKASRDNLLKLLDVGGNKGFVYSSSGLTVVLMLGLQGSGKTTTSAKLANYLKQKNKKVLLCACDLERLAAVEQLKQLAIQIEVDIYFEENTSDVVSIAKNAKKKALNEKYDVLIVDTAGRISIDDTLMNELENVSKAISPDEKFYVADSLTGQDATKNAINFHNVVNISGIILTKYDGDSKGGIAISIASQVQVPLRFIGVGEKIEDFEIFLPDRIVSRLLGEGDIEGLSEKISSVMDEKDIAKISKKIKKGSFNFNDFINQMDQIKKMGSMKSIMSMMPGMGNIKEQLENVDLDNSKEIKVLRACVNSMTPKERENPDLLMKNNSRKRRISLGAGVEVVDLNRMLKQFKQSSKMAKKLSSGGMQNMQSMMQNMNLNMQRPF